MLMTDYVVIRTSYRRTVSISMTKKANVNSGSEYQPKRSCFIPFDSM
jgi:hypothetical protein